MLGRRFEVAFGLVVVAVALVGLLAGLLAGAAAHADAVAAGFDAAAWAAAVVTAGTFGTAGVCHAIAMRRIPRRRLHDVAIAVVGSLSAVLVLSAALLALWLPLAATVLVQLAWPLWVGGLAVAAYLLHAVTSRPARPPIEPATIVVLGGALRGRRVSPLLARRVERGAELWRAHPEARLVVSGGQGHDEVVSEAEAMAAHLRQACDVPAEVIDLEDRSTTTDENLVFARALGAREPWLVVTSEYHVPRARVLLRRLGIAGDAAGSRSSPLYRPGALVRELAATLWGSRVSTAIVAIATVVVTVAGVARAVALAA